MIKKKDERKKKTENIKHILKDLKGLSTGYVKLSILIGLQNI